MAFHMPAPPVENVACNRDVKFSHLPYNSMRLLEEEHVNSEKMQQ